MITSKKDTNTPEKKKSFINYEDELFFISKNETDEIESDGSASAFDNTECVTEDNFDNLSDK